MKQVTQDWLSFALTDLKSCEMIINDAFLSNVVAFHSQQAIEKVFKAVMEEYEVGFIKTHDLVTLHNAVKGYIDFEPDVDLLIQINEVYLASRYPGHLGLLADGKPTIKEAETFYKTAKDIFYSVKKELEKN